MDGSRTASNRSLQWGEKITEPVFESKNDYNTMYMLARKFGFADKMFKNIKVENGDVSAEDILRVQESSTTAFTEPSARID
jgi:formate dehydrogenase major subunit